MKRNPLITIDIFIKIIIVLILLLDNLMIIKDKKIYLNNNNQYYKISKEDNFFSKTNKIYNASEFSFFTIILNYVNSKLDIKQLSNLISHFLNQIFEDLTIIVLCDPSNNYINNTIIKYKNKSKKILFYLSDNKNFMNNLFKIIYILKTKYVIFIEEFIELQNNDLYNIYNMLKGNINNIFKYSLTNNRYLLLIRFKILSDILDYRNTFQNIWEIINISNSYQLPKLNYIPVAFCPSNYYTTLTYTSMLSILSSKADYTYITFYIVISKNFSEYNIQFLEGLYRQYDYFNISFIKMDNRYKNAFTARYLTIHAYYRYSLSELIPHLNKIIYLDADTICLNDLSQMYNLNFKGKLILGRIIKSFEKDNNKYIFINTGVLLLNLKGMRLIQFEKKMLNILSNGFGKKKNIKYDVNDDIRTVDQALINIYFYKYLGPLSPKYNLYSFDNYDNYKRISKVNNISGNIYGKDNLYFSFKYPSIRHYYGRSKRSLINSWEWIYYIRKSIYFHEINKKALNIM